MERALAEAGFAATSTRRYYFYAIVFVLFFCSGFCSLLYQVVWVRLAFGHFGVITPVLSCVLSVFMLGLGIGSLAGGAWARWWSKRFGASAAYLYGAIEIGIGVGAFVVPWLFQLGEESLLRSGETASFSSYFLVSAILIFVAILPWCTLMGATIPVMMSFIRKVESVNRSSFSFLYLANVIGALAGVVLSALVLIEMFGFRATYMIAATINLCTAAIAFVLARSWTGRAIIPPLAR
jgi:spermidine synthase